MNSNASIKLLIIGDYLILRTGLKMLLENEKDFRVVGETASLLEASNLIIKNKPDILLIDALETEKEEFKNFHLKNIGNLPFIVISFLDGIETFEKCFKIGANGLVSKKDDAETLVNAVRQVAEGKMWFDRTIMSEVIKRMMDEKNGNGTNGHSDGLASLSNREIEVLRQVCNGNKNKEIADQLFISETTVRHHLTSIFEKLKVNSRLQLVVYAFQNNLVEVPEKPIGQQEI